MRRNISKSRETTYPEATKNRPGAAGRAGVLRPSRCSQILRSMNRTDVMLAVVEMARVGGAMPSDEAISHVAALIDRLDKAGPSYEADVRVLLSIGATIWQLQQGAGA